MHRRNVVLGSLALVAAGGLSVRAPAQQKLVLKVSDVHPAGYPTVVAVENLGKDSTHVVRPGNRASRQASAALSPSRRAMSMNCVLSGEPAPSIARSMARAS